MGFIYDQLEDHHGFRFTKEQKTGPEGVRLKKDQLLDMIFAALEI